MSYGYKNIICAYLPHVRYHDDMLNERVIVLDFPYKDYFIDFRFLNGLKMLEVDEIIGKLRETMIDIRNRQFELEREEYLKKQAMENNQK